MNIPKQLQDFITIRERFNKVLVDKLKLLKFNCIIDIRDNGILVINDNKHVYQVALQYECTLCIVNHALSLNGKFRRWKSEKFIMNDPDTIQKIANFILEISHS